jgi:hypothetical protein
MNAVTVRASSLPGLFDCPARWAAIHIEGRRMPTSDKAALGKAVHASTAVFDQSTLDGAGITADEAKAAAVDAIHHPDEETVWEDMTPTEAESIALSLHAKYCATVAPEQTYAAVEVTCDALEISDLGLVLTGTTDRIRKVEDDLGRTHYGIADLKTGKTAVGTDGTAKTQGHAFQLGVYELLAQAASGVPITAPAQIIGLNTAKTEKSQRIGTGEVAGAREVLLGDGEVPGVLENASRLIHAGLFFGNPRSMMCSVRYCPNFNTCPFRK